jgi:MAF protein
MQPDSGGSAPQLRQRTLVLASSSPHRKSLLERLRYPFVTASPEIDESHFDGEPGGQLVVRLALAKARKLAPQYPDAVIIGSDQAALLEDRILAKPLTVEHAEEQLRCASGRRLLFMTGLCVLDAATGRAETVCEPYAVQFRSLSDEEIRNYVRLEQPLDCAGSFKSEGLGIALCERFEGDDPTALIGLPLIQLTRLLVSAGINVLAT